MAAENMTFEDDKHIKILPVVLPLKNSHIIPEI